MKYPYLAAWSDGFYDFSATLESVWIYRDCLALILKKIGKLIFVMSSRDSFLYLEPEYQIPPEAVEIWHYLRGSSLSDIRIQANDRIYSIELTQKDIYGDLKRYTLLLEFMPPKPNAILLKKERELSIVHDAIIKYSFADNPMRQVLPAQLYFPPSTGFMPDRTLPSFPQMVDDAVAEDINSYLRLTHQKILKPQDSLNDASRKIKALDKELKRIYKRLDSQKHDLAMAEQAEHWKACAEAIKPNLTKIRTGQTELVTTNYLDPEMKDIAVPLFPDKSPLQNLNLYLKKYHKAKNGYSVILTNIAKSEAELKSIQSLIIRIQQGEMLDLDATDTTSALRHRLNQLDKLLGFRIGEAWHIYIGRKAKENDFISTKLGKPQDWWFHSRIYRGAHVLLRNYKKQEPNPELIRICCSLAAWYSQAKFSQNVPVDYTQIRYVRKPRSSAPGFVTYTNYKTYFAEPKDLRSVKSELGL